VLNNLDIFPSLLSVPEHQNPCYYRSVPAWEVLLDKYEWLSNWPSYEEYCVLFLFCPVHLSQDRNNSLIVVGALLLGYVLQRKNIPSRVPFLGIPRVQK